MTIAELIAKVYETEDPVAEVHFDRFDDDNTGVVPHYDETRGRFAAASTSVGRRASTMVWLFYIRS